MPQLGTVPTESAHNWNTEYAASIRDVSQIFLTTSKLAMPTLRILLAHAKPYELGPDGKMRWNFEHEVYSPHRMTKNQVYSFDDIDPISQMEWETKQWWIGAGINKFERTRYGRGSKSMVDLAATKVRAIHKGATLYENYSIFSNWSETISGNAIDIGSALSGLRVPPELSFKDISSVTEMMYSIPMIIRKPVTGHTIGNVATGTTGSTANLFWQPLVTDGAVITRATTGNAIDVVTDDDTNTVPLDIDDLDEHLGAMQVGAEYNLYAPCSRGIYRVLKNYILAERRRTPADDDLTARLGITGSVTMEEYNCTFYIDPMMDALWPGTIWYFDPDCMFLTYDPAFYPDVEPWGSIPGTNISGTVASWDMNLVCVDRQGVSAMHGYASDE